MKIISASGQRDIDTQLKNIIEVHHSGLAMTHDKETGSFITALVVDGAVSGWSITGPYSPAEADQLKVLKLAALEQQGFPTGPAALEGQSIN